MTHQRFSDAAGYTRHCWECVHAKDWTEASKAIGGSRATCELTLRPVWKYDSPSNPCSHLPIGCDYERMYA